MMTYQPSLWRTKLQEIRLTQLSQTINNDFTEADYDPVDQILELQEERTKHVHFDQITMHELISAQLHDAFCSDICRRLNLSLIHI